MPLDVEYLLGLGEGWLLSRSYSHRHYPLAGAILGGTPHPLDITPQQGGDRMQNGGQTRRAEIKVAVAFADHLSPLLKKCFPDSKIAKKYSSARTKTSAIINRAVSPYLLSELVKLLREKPFSLSTDGSDDTGKEKMNPITVKTFDKDGVVHRFLDMGVTEGEHCGTAETIFAKMDAVLKKHSIPFFIKKLMSKFLKPGAFRDVDVYSVDSVDEDNQLPDAHLGIGFTTRTTLNRLVEAGHVSPEAVKKFHMAARSFFKTAVEYALAKLPLNDQVLQYSKFVDFKQKMDVSVDYVQFNHLLPYDEPKEQDQLNDEFLEYQMMEETHIPDAIWRDAVVRQSEDGEYHRMDRLWAHLSTVKNRISGTLQFPRLVKIAQLVLSLPHSNADAEQTFSVVGLNKTDTRNRLSLDGTLSSIMTIKMNDTEPCYKYEPPAQIVKDAKSATTRYNRPNLSTF
ncbi:hypothetical protein ACEWY4_013935 [Coilia grayii]|uniref:HAT C-terminal dimerisation domain-containing protein n=1 Tax=Coilia grayii TaxID=363190 RepID=A0ABD1JXT6_9TELE